MNQFFKSMMTISAVALAVGLALPLGLALVIGDVKVPLAVWDTLQVGGLGGLVLFGLAYKVTRPRTPAADVPAVAVP